MRFLFVMDLPAVVELDSDTSFALMLEAQALGHRVDHARPCDLFLVGGVLHAQVRRAHLQRDPVEPIALAQGEDVNLESVDAVFVRTEPPFDTSYLWTTLLLERLRGKTLVLNDPRGLREADEKLYACEFPELMPETMVTSHPERIKNFVRQVGGRAVIKPIAGLGGESAMALIDGDTNLRAIVDSVTSGGRRLAMIQRYLPESKQGDKRILLLDGEPVGALLRLPHPETAGSEPRADGSKRAGLRASEETTQSAQIEPADRKIVERIAPRLRQDGLFLVSIDVIGGLLTGMHVTSPRGIQQLARFDKLNVARVIIEWVVKKVASA